MLKDLSALPFAAEVCAKAFLPKLKLTSSASARVVTAHEGRTVLSAIFKPALMIFRTISGWREVDACATILRL